MPSRQPASPAAVSILHLILDKAILQAVEASEEYRAALSSEQAMLADIGRCRECPSLASHWHFNCWGYRERGGTKPSKTTTGIAGGIQASQLIYDGGESVANINSATAKAVGARVERIIIGNELALEAARAWIDVWQYEEKLDLLNARSKEMETVVHKLNAWPQMV